ncbi:unnamed protein product [Caenorhabditis sp. 36 PRJEB53466]|nr:unnamed protein product [Caenorhabditis sp. 36 PRJEB53466]
MSTPSNFNVNDCRTWTNYPEIFKLRQDIEMLQERAVNAVTRLPDPSSPSYEVLKERNRRRYEIHNQCVKWIESVLRPEEIDEIKEKIRDFQNYLDRN